MVRPLGGKKAPWDVTPTALAAYTQAGSQIQKQSSALVTVRCPDNSETTNPTGNRCQWGPG
ncbi:MAG: hypothetical protein DME22_06350 [Verrucomicrobia bacterium]|nr:MAG: hypothetical protein DME22_06350 [Verrucomicrobiota bacterium]